MRHWTEAEVDKLVRLRRERLGTGEIARALGVSTARVRDKMAALGIARPRRLFLDPSPSEAEDPAPRESDHRCAWLPEVPFPDFSTMNLRTRPP